MFLTLGLLLKRIAIFDKYGKRDIHAAVFVLIVYIGTIHSSPGISDCVKA